jgi:hypothetical protein
MALPVSEQIVYYAAVGGEIAVKLQTDDQGFPWGRTSVGICESGLPQTIFLLDGAGHALVPANRLARFLACVAGSSLA